MPQLNVKQSQTSTTDLQGRNIKFTKIAKRKQKQWKNVDMLANK
jgi:hypothetical protein